MLIDRILGARIDGHREACDIVIGGGHVRAVTSSTGVPETDGRGVGEGAEGDERGDGDGDGGGGEDEGGEGSKGGRGMRAGGRVIVPALVDAHVHLDKAFLLAAAEAESGPPKPELGAAIAAVARLRTRVSPAVIRRGAERAIDRLVAQGVTAARVHVEIDVGVGLELVRLHQELAARASERIALQLVAFPQRGLEAPGMPELLEAAMGEGLGVVGGCPYVDADPARHLDLVYELADRHGAPIDLHLDFTDAADRSLLDLVVERTRAHGMRGRVTIGHVTTLAAMSTDAQARALATIAEAGIALVILPATDLYLGGHGEPGTRSLAPWERALEAGIRVAIGNNNIENPFAPFGNGNLLQAAWLAGLMRRAAEPKQRRALLDMVTRAPASIMGLPAHGVGTGEEAHLVLVDDDEPDGVALRAPTVMATLRAGRLVYVRREPDIASCRLPEA